MWNGYQLFIGDDTGARMPYGPSKTVLSGSGAFVQPANEGVNVVWTGREKAWFEVAAKALLTSPGKRTPP